MSENPGLRLSLEQSTPIVCESCGNETFIEVTYLRKISKLLAATSNDVTVPIPTYACSKCGHINPEFRLKSNEPKEPETKSSGLIL